LLPYLPTTDHAEMLSPKQMTMTMEVMAHSLVWWVRDLAAAGLLRPGSHVLAMTSAGDSRVAPAYGAVSTAKSALLAHVRQLAVELAPLGVSVNALRAGVTLTPSFARIPGSEQLADKARAANPFGRLTTPDDVAEAVATLTATRSSWVTGNVIAADGGEGLTT
jgi:enoyl-[acyl-carrier-protein] reductase (NADH)